MELDELMRIYTKDPLGPSETLEKLRKQAIEHNSEMLERMKQQAIDAVIHPWGQTRAEAIEIVRKQLADIRRQLAGDFGILRVRERLAEIAQELTYISALSTRRQNENLLKEIALSIPRIDTSFISESLRDLINIDFRKIAGISDSAKLVAFNIAAPDAFDDLQDTFTAEVAESIKESVKASAEGEINLAAIEELFEKKIKSLPRNKVSAEGMANLLLQVLAIFLMVLYAQRQVDIGKRQLEVAERQLEDARQPVIAQATQLNQQLTIPKHTSDDIAQLIPKDDRNVYYVITQDAFLRVKPDGRTKTITAISSNQKVRLVQTKAKWLYVEYFDYLEAVPKYGWINEKYTKRIEE
jgi:hypothetical protein